MTGKQYLIPTIGSFSTYGEALDTLCSLESEGTGIEYVIIYQGQILNRL